MTEFWFKLVDMTKSDAPVISLGGRALTEKQLLWIIALVILIVVVLLLRSAILWIFNPTPSKKKGAKENETPVDTTKTSQAPVPQTVTKEVVTTAAVQNPPINAEKVEQTAPQDTPADLLADTSEKKRSMQDYVTPDAVTSEVIKQPITNDYPYQTLKPDPTKVGMATPAIQSEPVKEVVIDTPVVASVESPVTATEMPTQPSKIEEITIDTSADSLVAPVPSPTPQPASAEPEPITTVLPLEPIEPAAPIAVEPIQTTGTNSEAVTAPVVTTVLPEISEKSVIPTVATPTSQEIPEKPIATSPAPATNSSTVLPPLPEKEPTSHMVVGVADEKNEPIKKTTFNPVDPIIP